MALDPKIAKKLLAEVPEMVEFRDFLVGEASKLDTLTGMEEMKPEERAIEVTARMRAKKVIDTILGPLLNVQEGPAGASPREFQVNVEDLLS